MSLLERDEVPGSEKWDPSLVFASPAEWEDAVDTFEERLDELRTYEGRLVEDGQTLGEVLDLVEELQVVRMGSIHLYAFLTNYVDTTDESARQRMARYRELRAELESAMDFLGPELRESGRERVEELIETTPELESHNAHLRRLRSTADHTLSRDAESVLADLEPTFESGSRINREIAQGDVIALSMETPSGEETTVTPQTKPRLLQSDDREFRRQVHERFRAELTSHRHGMAAAYTERIREDCTIADIRDYDSALRMHLSGGSSGLRGGFPVEAYETVIEGIADRLEPYHRLLRARRDALGIAELREWDLQVPIVPGDPPHVAYDDAVDLILASVEPLGGEYVGCLAEILEQRRVDVRQTANKRRGPKAIQISSTDDGPFLALNYDGGLRALYLFTHELGHAMNRLYAADEQRPIDEGVPVHTGEVASFLHEALLVDHLVEVWSDDRSLHAQSVYLNKLPLYRAASGAQFIHELHKAIAEGTDLGPDALNDRHREIIARFREPVSLGEHAGAGWQEINLSRDPYHAYLYAVGAIGSLSLVRVLRNDTLDNATYRDMLARGRSVRSNKAFAPVLDFTDDATVERGMTEYRQRVDRLLADLDLE